jgi:hypothetical protein
LLHAKQLLGVLYAGSSDAHVFAEEEILLLSGHLNIPVGTEATLRIPAGLGSISMKGVVCYVRSHQIGFETVGMALEDRAKLRRLLGQLLINAL